MRPTRRKVRNWSYSADDLRNGLNVYEGLVTYRAVASALKLKFTPAEAALRL